MKTIAYKLSQEIFVECPNYMRGLVVATGIDNTNATDALVHLRSAESALVSATTLESFIAAPQIMSWREAFKKFGMNPGEFRPAHEALGRRVLQGKRLPNINAAVNLGNALSIRHQIPVGVHPLQANVGMELRRARGDESFVPFGSEKNDTPQRGEVIFADGNTVLSRSWVWRQAQSSVTLPTTRAIVVNLDALPPVSEDQILSICTEAEALVKSICGGQITCSLLTAANPSTTFIID